MSILLGWQKKFDLIFASICPGINSRNTLEKMVNVYTLERAFPMHISHFEMAQPLSGEQKTYIFDYLEGISKKRTNGLVEEKIEAKIAWMYWKI